MTIPIGGTQVFTPATKQSSNGAHARKWRERKKEGREPGSATYQPDKKALASLEELKRERGLT